jgi:hypothetical protein
MSSYIDHYGDGRKRPPPLLHSWTEFTAARLAWLYGPGREDTAESRADRAAWERLGGRRAA